MPDALGYPLAAEMNLGAVLDALGDANRRRVVAELAVQPDFTELECSSFAFPLARSTQTHLFKVLRESGLVVCTDYGNHRGVTLRRQEVEDRFPGLLDILANEVRASDTQNA